MHCLFFMTPPVNPYSFIEEIYMKRCIQMNTMNFSERDFYTHIFTSEHSLRQCNNLGQRRSDCTHF